MREIFFYFFSFSVVFHKLTFMIFIVKVNFYPLSRRNVVLIRFLSISMVCTII